MDGPPSKENAAPSGEAHGGGSGKHVTDNPAGELLQAAGQDNCVQEAEAVTVVVGHAAQEQAGGLHADVGAGPHIATPEQGKPATGTMRTKSRAAATLVSRRGWVKVYKADQALINQECGDQAATTFAVWVALLTIANNKQEVRFQATRNALGCIAGVSLSTVKRALSFLEKLGFISVERVFDVATKQNFPNWFTLLRSADYDPTPSGHNDVTRSVDNECRGRVNERSGVWTGIKESAFSAKKRKRGAERSARADAPTPAPSGIHKRPRNFYSP